MAACRRPCVDPTTRSLALCSRQPWWQMANASLLPESRVFVAILASGASRRLGQPKQLVSLEGEPLLRRQCRIAVEARIGPVAVILGCHANECDQLIEGLP